MKQDQQECPFCTIRLDKIVFSTESFVALMDEFPVTPGHLLLVSKTHLAEWSSLSSRARENIAEAINEAKERLQAEYAPDGFNIGFNEGAAAGQTIPHFHIHVIPRRKGDMEDPRGGVRHVIPDNGNYLRPKNPLQVKEMPANFNWDSASNAMSSAPHDLQLITGGDDPLYDHLIQHISDARKIDIAVSFVMDSGMSMIAPRLQDFLHRDGKLRLLTTDYMDVTDPSALHKLNDLSGNSTTYVYESKGRSFHPKSWIVELRDGSGIAMVGSSNLSKSALTSGIEWNFRFHSPGRQDGWLEAKTAFEELLQDDHVSKLTVNWIDKYSKRRAPKDIRRKAFPEIEAEADRVVPTPHGIQTQALFALEETRREGYGAGLCVLATGLGKTWLSAFDTNRPEFQKVLFVAHREEILNQAVSTFRKIRPDARLGRYTGKEKSPDAEVVFASVQTLGKMAHLRKFRADAFDYIVIDEFHHASAQTYRKVIDHFTPKFMLGLTATPERMDGGDLLGLCEQNLVFRCDAFEGIEKELLSPFKYFGVPDDVDYANIPWRRGRFDETELTTALATAGRAQNALEQFQLHAGEQALGFCCSTQHADFMAKYFCEHGVSAVAVHSASPSAPRSASLEALEQGKIEIIFSIDMFNEGVDVPSIDCVLMLRPTESSTIFLQQFGRGLRRSDGKSHLTVVDYIGNHRSFLAKAQTLLQTGEGNRALAIALEQLDRNELTLPPGCEITYELEARDMLKALATPPKESDAAVAFYDDFKLRHGVRPRALEMYQARFSPRKTGHGDWLKFVAEQNDLTLEQGAQLRRNGRFLSHVETTQLTKSYKLLVLKAMMLGSTLIGDIELSSLARKFTHLASRNPKLVADISVDHLNLARVTALLKKHPIEAWTNSRSGNGAPFFEFHDDVFSSTLSAPHAEVGALHELAAEVIEWRMAEYLDRASAHPANDTNHNPNFVGDTRQLVLWDEYSREEIAPMFGLKFNTGAWNQGFVVQGKIAFLLVTLDKTGFQDSHKYSDRFLDAVVFEWISQNRTKQDSKHGRIISGLDEYDLHLFVRPSKVRSGKATPFRYCGKPAFQSWENEKPITVQWRLEEPMPEHLHRSLFVGE
jgi:superfamily II DNA or RNA helicase/diadenosine tetraphosphate (Ap4A) HIT family hydrolase